MSLVSVTLDPNTVIKITINASQMKRKKKKRLKTGRPKKKMMYKKSSKFSCEKNTQKFLSERQFQRCIQKSNKGKEEI